MVQRKRDLSLRPSATRTSSLNIRTDKWRIVATGKQKQLLQNTVSEFRCLVRGLVGVIYTHWSTIGKLKPNEQIPAVERLIHTTSKNPGIKYKYFGSRFYKFPSYYRRGAIRATCTGRLNRDSEVSKGVQPLTLIEKNSFMSLVTLKVKQ